MNCEETQNFALLSRSNEASEAQKEKLQKHIALCPECRKKINEQLIVLQQYRRTNLELPLQPAWRKHIIQQTQPGKAGITGKIIRLTTTAIATAAVIMFTFISLNNPLLKQQSQPNQPLVKHLITRPETGKIGIETMLLAFDNYPTTREDPISAATSDITAAEEMLSRFRLPYTQISSEAMPAQKQNRAEQLQEIFTEIKNNFAALENASSSQKGIE